jgi:hypothetical protein
LLGSPPADRQRRTSSGYRRASGAGTPRSAREGRHEHARSRHGNSGAPDYRTYVYEILVSPTEVASSVPVFVDVLAHEPDVRALRWRPPG